jgi:hypothetical protein
VNPADEADALAERLDEIAKAIEGGADPISFKEELDQLLGTEMQERDHEAEARWEESYRRKPEERS